MSMLFEKCESATANIGKVTSTEMFNSEMREFASAMSINRATMPDAPPLIGGNEELDNLVCCLLPCLFWYEIFHFNV